MPKFLITYYGGEGMPADPQARQQAMEAFGAWVASVGGAMVDPGAPLNGAKSVTADGVREGPTGEPIGGYTLLSADSIDEAVGLVQSHPYLTRGGTLQVSEAVQVG